MDRGHDDVRRRFVRELDDPLAEIGLDGREAFGFERRVEMNLFGRHALRLDDARRRARAQQAQHDGARLGRVARPMHLRARALGVIGKLCQILIKMRERLVLDRARALAQAFPIVDGRDRNLAPFTERRRQITQRPAQLRIGQRLARVLVESLCG